MITKSTIRALCNDTAYSRGREIYHSGNRISELCLQESEDEKLITAQVKGSLKEAYTVKMKYDKRKEVLNKIYCECPAFHTYAGICKHCVAVLLKYLDYEKQAARECQTAQAEKPVCENFQPASALYARQTTPSVKQFLDMEYQRRMAPYKAPETYGRVRLVPFLRCRDKNISLEFQIGVSRMYILKDVFAFVQNMRENSSAAYGQKLEFVHMPEAFAPKSREIVQFLMDWAEKNEGKYLHPVFNKQTYAVAHQPLRTIPLREAELEDFLEAVGLHKFTAQIGRDGEKEWQAAEGMPRRTITLTGRLDGVEIRMEKIYHVEGNRYHMYFEDGIAYLVSKTEAYKTDSFVGCLELLPGKEAFIQKADIPVFAREILPELEKQFTCIRKNFEETRYGVVRAKYEFYLDAPRKDLITCSAFAVYGEEKFSLFGENSTEINRDFLGETEAAALLRGYFNAFDEEKKELLLVENEEKIYLLLAQGIGKLQEQGEVFITDALKKIRVLGTPKVRLGVSLSSGLLTLDMAAEDMSREELAEILSRYNRKKKYYRLKDGSFINMENEEMDALLDLKAGMYLSQKELRQEKIELPAYRALYLDSRTEKEDKEYLKVIKNEEFCTLIKRMKTTQEEYFTVPKEQESIMREYQKQGFVWLKTLKKNGFGGILADDMGLGKTLQVISFLWSEYQEISGKKTDKNSRFCLIVTPASLVFNWASEIEKFAPDMPVKMIIGTADERKKLIKNASHKEVLITSYELLRRDISHYNGLVFANEVIDEAQFIKNHGTQAAQAVKAVAASFKTALTGTPMENRLSELWSIFDYLMPGFLYGYEQFRKEVELPVVTDKDEKVSERLRQMIRPFVLRRLKKDVLKDLPDKLEKDMFVRLESEQSELYEAHAKNLKMTLGSQSDREYNTSKLQILAEITRLRQLCCHPGLLYEDYKGSSAKLNLCLDLIENAVSGGHKILLFSQFTSMLEILQRQLHKRKISYYSLTGTTSKEERSRLVNAFNEDETSVFCISLRAGGTGLNLTSADIVIHYDPWWNLAVQNQATDRAHRIGQTNVVSVYRLFAKGTIEEKIRDLQAQKKELADEILSGEGLDSGRMDKEELLSLLEM